MSIPENKRRVALTLPNYAIEAFHADAAQMGMSLSTYVYHVLTANSFNLPDWRIDYSNQVLDSLQEAARLETELR